MLDTIINVALLLTTFALGFATGQAIEAIRAVKEDKKEREAQCQK